MSGTETIFGKLIDAAARHAERDLFVVPERLRVAWGLSATSFRYSDVAATVSALSERYRQAGYGAGHRVALLLENRPAHFFHWLALNALGASAVPINPDYLEDETDYLVSHSESVLIVAAPSRMEQVAGIAAQRKVPLMASDAPDIPAAIRPAPGVAIDRLTEAALLYTSGTTGRPKGCMLSNEFFFTWGEWYSAQTGLISLREGQERLLQPLPTFHTNAMGNSFMGMLMTGGAQVILDRFHPKLWWQEAVETGATCFHFLGVMPAMLLNVPEGPFDRAHRLRFGLGGGLAPQHHHAFEARFGIPLCEGWAMTETGGAALLCSNTEPRHIGTHCIGRPDRPGPAMEMRVETEEGEEAPKGTAGNFLVRAAGPNPRKGFFSGYLKDDAATQAAWKGGWLNTGDIVQVGEDGSVYFVDRRKNIIRRSGENIAAAEVEATLVGHPDVKQAAVFPVQDDIRGEEVAAVIVLAEGRSGGPGLAADLFTFVSERMAYYKAPGYVAFSNVIPTTSTQKVRKAELTALIDPKGNPSCHDLRDRKKRIKAKV